MASNMATNNVKFLHESIKTNVVNGKRSAHEEFLIHGEKGMTIKFFHKDDKKVEKIVITKKPEGGYLMKTIADGKQTEKTIDNKEDLVKELKKNKDLEFAIDYVKGAKDLARAGSKKSSKKHSKKSSKKHSKKSSKKHSKKSSKKHSKKH
jgi:hypothetical protein